jgi:cytochrome c
VTFTGEDIYTARCFACHLFDQKKVGPPYFKTIPKYEGKKAELVAFILNPTKVDPAYPPMPNQGLRLAEADSIASYIIRKVAASNPRSMK